MNDINDYATAGRKRAPSATDLQPRRKARINPDTETTSDLSSKEKHMNDLTAESRSNQSSAQKNEKGKKKKKGGVTLTPIHPKGAAKGAAAAAGGKLAAAAAKKKPAAEKSKVISKSSIAQHIEWQDEAVKFGGPNAKIIVSKPVAKKVIFDMLHDEFCPMNINRV